MKKALRINIQGIIFHMDEDAFEMLQEYLSALHTHYNRQPGGAEIISDIELRIAELFQEKITPQKQVVTSEDVDAVMEILGKPEEFFDAGEEESTEKGSDHRTSRKLYRDPDNSVIAGIAGGLGAYFAIDPVWIRVLFILLIFAQGMGILIYGIMWIVVPTAKTTSQKLEMKGEEITVSNIQKSVKEEYEDIKENVKKMKSSPAYRKTRNAAHEAGNVMQDIGRGLLTFISVIIGVVFIFGGFALLVSFLGVILFEDTLFPWFFHDHNVFSLQTLLPIFFESVHIPWIIVSFICVICIPLVSLIYAGLKLVFRFHSNDKLIGLTAFVLWFLSLMMLIGLGMIEGQNFVSKGKVIQKENLDSKKEAVLQIQLNDNFPGIYQKVFIFNDDDWGIYLRQQENVFYGRPELDIEPGHGDDIEIIIQGKGYGRSRKLANEYAGAIEYTYLMKDDQLSLDPFFRLPEGVKWRFPEIEILLKIPDGTKIYLEEGMEKVVDYIDNTEHAWDYEMTGRYWVMKKDHLSPLN